MNADECKQHAGPAAPAVELGSLRLTLDEQPHAVAIDGCEAETFPNRPLYAPGQWFDSYTSAVRHLDPPRLFESRPSYRLLGQHLDRGTLHFGLTAYFDKLDVSEALGHELAIAVSAGTTGFPTRPSRCATRCHSGH